MEGAHQILTFNDAILIGFGIWVAYRTARHVARWALRRPKD